jgi:ribonuclease P protein component
LPFATAIASSPIGLDPIASGRPTPKRGFGVTKSRPERIGPEHRLRTSIDYAAVKRDARAFKGRHCMLLAAARPEQPTRVGFIASKKGVGGAVQRNRARRRLREIVRRRWPLVALNGHDLAFIAYRTSLTAPHVELAAEVERLLSDAGAFPMESGA